MSLEGQNMSLIDPSMPQGELRTSLVEIKISQKGIRMSLKKKKRIRKVI